MSLQAVTMIQGNGSTNSTLKSYSYEDPMRKTARVLNPQVPKHDVAPPAQTCRHRGYANQDTHANDFSTAR